MLAALRLRQASWTPQFAPLHTGISSSTSSLPFWRKEDAAGWSGEGWLGWTYTSRNLTPVALVVRDRPKEAADDADYVTVEFDPEVTFAVRCLPGVQPGAIRTAGVVNHSLEFNGVLRIPLGARRYEVRLRSRREDRFDATVVLSDGRRSQVLYSADGFADDPHFEVEWAGDLDNDGRLDLIVNLSRKYSVHPHRLLLSSRAARDQLVGEAGVFENSD